VALVVQSKLPVMSNAGTPLIVPATSGLRNRACLVADGTLLIPQ
jgi:hypothetical protein